MNPFLTTTMTYSLVHDRRRSFEQASTRRRWVRSSASVVHPAPTGRRPPDPAPVLTLVELDILSGQQHLPAAPVCEPTTARVA